MLDAIECKDHIKEARHIFREINISNINVN